MVQDSFQEQLSIITDLFSNTRLRQDFVATIVDKLQEWTGCECVGIRIVNPDDYMPYDAYVGFSQEFWEYENWLSLREAQCACIRIVNNETIPADRPILTENGSILSNDLQAFGKTLSAAEDCLYRGKCIDCGFGSLAVVPIRKQGEVIGLIHLADKRTNFFQPDMIETFEALTESIAEVIARLNSEDQLAYQKADMEQFLYSVSHDLKSPLSTVKSFVSMLRRDIPNGNQEKNYKSLDYINMAADKMQELLEDLLQYSQVDRNGILLQTVSVNQLIEDCLTILADILQQKEVQVKTREMPYKLHGNLLLFGRIWQNLIENAVKYMGDQAHPLIEIGATQKGHEVVFYVSDNGMGVDPAHHVRIFNMFSQLNLGSDGSGLGLALVKKIVSSYQGRIWVESEGKGKGSCFKFTLPGALTSPEKKE